MRFSEYGHSPRGLDVRFVRGVDRDTSSLTNRLSCDIGSPFVAIMEVRQKRVRSRGLYERRAAPCLRATLSGRALHCAFWWKDSRLASPRGSGQVLVAVVAAVVVSFT